jgi:hypothetical protein
MHPALPFPLAGTVPVATPTGVHPVACAAPRFLRYAGPDATHRFGGKEPIAVDGRPQFAEVAILRAFEALGWQGRWVETYGNPRLRPALWQAWAPGGPAAQQHVPIAEPWVNERLLAIARANGGTFGGCWDVVVWQQHRLCFVESKRRSKDRLRATQGRWLAAALHCGCGVEDFLVVEWEAGQG